MNFFKKKLKEGDYVENLTKAQFDLLIKIEDHQYKLHFHQKTDGLHYDGEILRLPRPKEQKRKLSYRRFKRRTKNTFQ